MATFSGRGDAWAPPDGAACHAGVRLREQADQRLLIGAQGLVMELTASTAPIVVESPATVDSANG